jgi:hypothetical protein
MRVALVHESLIKTRYDKVLAADGADGADEPGSRHEIESTAQVQNRAAFQDILDLRRCNCNALKAQGISGPLHPPALDDPKLDSPWHD